MPLETVLHCATGKGVYTVTKDTTGNWDIRNKAHLDWSVPKIAWHPARRERVFAGTRGDGVWVSDDFGETWSKPCYGKQGPGKVRCATVDPHNADRLFAGTEPIGILVSDDAGESWRTLDSLWSVPGIGQITYPVSSVEPHVRDIVFDSNRPGTLYAALQVGYMLKSTDDGASWQVLDKGLDADVHTIVIDPSNTDCLFVATGGHDYRKGTAPGRSLYKSVDAGESWSPTAMEFQQEYSVPLAMHPNHPEIVYSALANGTPGQWKGQPRGAEAIVIRTQDSGKTWESLERGLAETNGTFAEAIVLDPDDPRHVYAGLRNGEIYASDDGGDSWKNLKVELPNISDIRCVGRLN
jgi:photosystem II stability/assembly factor-like uncharacterized protein